MTFPQNPQIIHYNILMSRRSHIEKRQRKYLQFQKFIVPLPPTLVSPSRAWGQTLLVIKDVYDAIFDCRISQIHTVQEETQPWRPRWVYYTLFTIW